MGYGPRGIVLCGNSEDSCHQVWFVLDGFRDAATIEDGAVGDGEEDVKIVAVTSMTDISDVLQMRNKTFRNTYCSMRKDASESVSAPEAMGG